MKHKLTDNDYFGGALLIAGAIGLIIASLLIGIVLGAFAMRLFLWIAQL